MITEMIEPNRNISIVLDLEDRKVGNFWLLSYEI